jgi:hypothetical protein
MQKVVGSNPISRFPRFGWVGEHTAMGRVPSTRQLALLAVSLTASDDAADDPLGHEEALAALAGPHTRGERLRERPPPRDDSD